jgi:hypothetical protein
MTDKRGRRARWSAALLLAPGAAAVFGSTMSWALRTSATPVPTPIHTATNRPAPTLPSAGDLTRMTLAVQDNNRSVALLQKRINALQRQIRVLSAPLPASPDGSATSSDGRSPGSRPQQVAAQQPVYQALVPAAKPLRPPAVPPAVQAVTGASGAAK